MTKIKCPSCGREVALRHRSMEDVMWGNPKRIARHNAAKGVQCQASGRTQFIARMTKEGA